MFVASDMTSQLSPTGQLLREKALGDDVHLATTAGGSGGGSGGAPKPKPVKPKSEEQKLVSATWL